MRSSLVRCSTLVLAFATLCSCHDVPQAPITHPKPGPEWIRITMDDGVTDYPSWGGIDLLTQADTEFDFIAAETEFGTLHYGGCVQNCQDPSRWIVGTIDSGRYRGLGENASSVRTASSIVVAYEDWQTSTPYVKIGTCGGACYYKAHWQFGDVRTGELGSFNGTHSRVLAVDPNGGLNLLYHDIQAQNVHYAHCTSSCTDSASWQSVLLDSASFQSYDMAIGVGPTGRVHVLAGGDSANALTYYSCDTGCTSLANWNSIVLTAGNVGATPTILERPSGSIYVSYGSRYGSVPIGFATCPSACLSLAHWSFTSLPATAGSDVSMQFDAAGQPWIATSHGYLRGETTVLHCSAGCDASGSWTTMTIDSLGDGLDVAMVLDVAGQPRLLVSGNSVHYAQRPDTTVLAIKR